MEDLYEYLQRKGKENWIALVDVLTNLLDSKDTSIKDQQDAIDTAYGLLKEHRIYISSGQRTPKRVSRSLKNLKQKLKEKGRLL